MLVDLLAEIASRLNEPGGRTLVILHHNADLDAVGSALALQRLFPAIRMGEWKGVSRAGQRLLRHFDAEGTVLTRPALGDFSRFVAVDAGSPVQLGLADFPDALMVLDHHRPNEAWQALESDVLYYVDDCKSSCGEVVYELAQYAAGTMDADAATAIVAAIVADTAHFRFATADTLRVTAALLGAYDIALADIYPILDSKATGRRADDLSRRIAMIKTAQRTELRRVGPFLLCLSHVSAYEGAACRQLLRLGSDVALVGAQRKDEFRVSARATRTVVRAGFDCSAVLHRVCDVVGGGGFAAGGHDGAAGMNGPRDGTVTLQQLLDVCGRIARERLGALEARADTP